MINSNFSTLLIVYFLITFSVLGYGLFFEKIYEKKIIGKNLGFNGLLGIFFFNFIFLYFTLFYSTQYLS